MVPSRRAAVIVAAAAALGLSQGPAAPTTAQAPPAGLHAAAPDAAPAALAHRVGGLPGAVAAHGRWAWVGSGAQVVTLDLAAPGGPRVVERTALDAVAGDVSVRADGTRLAAVAGGAVVLWRIDGAGRSTPLGALDVSPQPQSYGGAPAVASRDAGRRLAWHGERLVVAMVDDGVAAVALRLAVADVDDGAPRWLATAERTLSEGPFDGGELHALAATTGHAVVAHAVTAPGRAAMAVSVFTLPAGAVPQHHGDWAADGRIADLAALDGDRVALLGERRGPGQSAVEPYVAVIDAAAVAARGSSALPTPPVFSAPHRLASGRDGRLYATLSGAQPQLVALDVDAAGQPTAASAWPRPTTAVAVAAVDGGLLWRDGGGVTRLALGGGAAPVAGSPLPLTPSASDVAFADGRLFAAAPDSPWPLAGGPADAPAELAPLTDAAGRLPVADAAARTLYDAMPQVLAADGGRLWLLDGVSSRALWQVERADPTAPRLRWRGDTRAHAVAAVGDGVWLADDRGLVALADRGGEALAEVDRHAVGDQRTVVALARRPGGVVALVRVLGALSTLVVFDVGADGGIVERGNVVLPSATASMLAPGVEVIGTRAYVAWQRLTIVDLTDPDRPVLAGGLVPGAADVPSGPAAPVFVDIAVDADAGRAVAAAGPDGTAVLDVRDPKAIRVLQWLATPGSARRVAMDGDRVAVAEMAGGVSIVAMTDASGARRAYLPLVMRSAGDDANAAPSVVERRTSRRTPARGDAFPTGRAAERFGARAATPAHAVWPVLEQRIGGAPGGVAGHGRWAWVASGASVRTVDLTDDGPAVVADTALDDLVGDVAVRGDGARLAAVVGGEVVVWRIDAGGRLERLGALDAAPQPRAYGGAPARLPRDGGRRLAWLGTRLVVAMGDDGDDGESVRLGVAAADGDGAPRWLAVAERTSGGPGTGASLGALTIAGDRAALAMETGRHGTRSHAVDVFDVPAAGAPTFRGSWPAAGPIAGMAAVSDGRLAVLGSRPAPGGDALEPFVGLLDAAVPNALGSLSLPTPPVFTTPAAIAAGADGQLYVALSGGQPRLLAVATAGGADPRLGGDWPLPTSTLALAVADGAILRRDGGGLWRLAPSPPPSAGIDGVLAPIVSGISDVAVHGGYVYAAAADSPWPLYAAPRDGRLAFAPPAAPAGRLPLADVAAPVFDQGVPQVLSAAGDALWLLDARSSRALWGVEGAEASAPVLRRRGDAQGTLLAAVGDGVWQADRRVLVALSDAGGEALAEVDRRERAGGTFAALGTRPGGAVALAAGGDVYTRHLEVYDAAPDGRIVARGRGGLPGIEGSPVAPSVTVSGTHAYVAWQWLSVVDIADPDRPVLLDTLIKGVPPTCVDIAVHGPLAVAACGAHGLAQFDAADPTRLRFVRRFDTPGFARRVAIDGERLYVADLAGGVAVYELAPWDAAGRQLFLPFAGR